MLPQKRGPKTRMTVQKAQARQLALVAGGILCFMLTLVGYQMWSLSSTKAAAQDADGPRSLQVRVNAAIDRGVDWMKSIQREDGTFPLSPDRFPIPVPLRGCYWRRLPRRCLVVVVVVVALRLTHHHHRARRLLLRRRC